MSGLYGPVQITGGGNQLIPVNISSGTVAMLIENRSYFDLLVAISPSTPQGLSIAAVENALSNDVLLSAGGWDVHIGPMTNGTLQVPPDALTDSPLGPYWTGNVWILPTQITNASNVTGIIEEPGDNIWITTYGPGEHVPDPGLSASFVPPTFQGRMIDVPIGAPYNASQNVTASAQNVWTNYGNSINMGNYPFFNPAISLGQATPGIIAALVYDVSLSMIALSATSGTAEAQRVSLGFNVLDSSSSSVGGLFYYYSVLLAHLANQNTAAVDIAYAHPKVVSLTVAAGAGPPYTIQPVFIVDFAVGGGGSNVKPMVLNTGFDVAATVPAGVSGGLVGIPFVVQTAAGNPWAY